MKREHRHELETNTLARYLSKWIDSGKPYAQVAVLGALAVVAAIVLWSWLGRASSGRYQQAWQAYNVAVEGFEPSLNLLEQAAKNHPNSPPGELAELTWADGQVFNATNAYLASKAVSKEALDGASEKYEDLIRRTSDPAIVSRAHLGLGRVYELRAEVDKAKAEYGKVAGPLEPIAKQSLERLKAGQSQASLEWLAKAEMPRVAMPAGPGTPGVRPDFMPDELATPQAESDLAPSFEDILKRIGEVQPDATDRYAPPGDQPPPGVTEDTPPADPQPPMTDQPPAEPEATPPATEPAAEEPKAENDAKSPQS